MHRFPVNRWGGWR